MKVSVDEMKAFAAKHLPPEQKAAPDQPKKKVCVAILAYDAKGYWRTFMSLAQALAKCAEKGWGFTYILKEGDSMVARGRSSLASTFLQAENCQDCTDLVYVDADVYWDGDEFMRLLSHDVDVVAAAYPFKNDSGNFPLRWSSQGIYEENGLWIVQAVTPGFLRIRRQALERMVMELPWMEVHDHNDGSKIWMFFDNLARHNGVYDEGYVFCERWRSVGGTVYIDPDIKLSHIGTKVFTHGTLREWVARKTEQVEKLHHDFPNIPPLKLFNATMGQRVDLAKEQEEAVKAGAPLVRLEGVNYDNKKLEGDDAQEEVQPSPTPQPPPESQLPPPLAIKGLNGRGPHEYR